MEQINLGVTIVDAVWQYPKIIKKNGEAILTVEEESVENFVLNSVHFPIRRFVFDCCLIIIFDWGSGIKK